MKAKILVAVMTFFVITAFKADNTEVKWMDFNEGYALAKKKNKIMLVDVYTEWCGWCKKMDRDAYAKPAISQVLNTDFISVKFNPEITNVTYSYEGKSYTGEQLAGVISNYQISGYPTTIFIYPKQKKSEVVVGYKNAEQMAPILAEMKKKFYGK
jgi:uncharacterized protein YyaL (SSP411 family)